MAPTVPEGECSGRDSGAALCADKNRNDQLPNGKSKNIKRVSLSLICKCN